MATLKEQARPRKVTDGVYVQDVPASVLKAVGESEDGQRFIEFLLSYLCDSDGNSFDDLQSAEDLDEVPLGLQEAIVAGLEALYGSPKDSSDSTP